jgi:hypothetical protein
MSASGRWRTVDGEGAVTAVGQLGAGNGVIEQICVEIEEFGPETKVT